MKTSIFSFKDKSGYIKGTIVTDTLENAIKYIKKNILLKKDIGDIIIKNKELGIKKIISL